MTVPTRTPLTPRRDKGRLMRTANLVFVRRIYKYVRRTAIHETAVHETEKLDAEKRVKKKMSLRA